MRGTQEGDPGLDVLFSPFFYFSLFLSFPLGFIKMYTIS